MHPFFAELIAKIADTVHQGDLALIYSRIKQKHGNPDNMTIFAFRRAVVQEAAFVKRLYQAVPFSQLEAT